VGELKERLVMKLQVQAEDIRIIQLAREIDDVVIMGDVEAIRTQNNDDEVLVVKLFMVLKSTSTATITLQVKDTTGAEKRKLSLAVNSGMRVDELKTRLHKEFKCVLPVAEQKLICGGRVMTNACVIGEYIPLQKKTMLLLMRQPDSEKEITLRIRVPGCGKEAISMSFAAKASFATIRHVVARSRGIPCDTEMFQFYHSKRRMEDGATLLSQNILKTTTVYLVPGVPVLNPSTQKLVYTFPPGHFEKVFKDTVARRQRAHTSRKENKENKGNKGNKTQSHQAAPTRKPKTKVKGRSGAKGKDKAGKGGLFSGLKKGFFDKQPMTEQKDRKTTSRRAVLTPNRAAAVNSLKPFDIGLLAATTRTARAPDCTQAITPELAANAENDANATNVAPSTSPQQDTAKAKAKRTPPTRRCMSFKDMLSDAMALSSPVAQKDQLEKHKKHLSATNPAVLPKKVDSI
jgi:hypothetical protein